MKLNKLLLLAFAPFLFSGSLPSLKYRALDNSGDPISGAKLYFYEAGTTTAAATYPTEADEIAETNANANPVVADSNGWFGEIFMQTDQAYKVVMKNSDDSTTYFTVDNIDAVQLSNADLLTRQNQIASNPLHYGAVGDGVADEDTYVQSAIDDASYVVDLLGKTYRCDNTVTLKSNMVLKNGTLDFTNSTESRFMTGWGTLGSALSVSSDIAAGATTFDLDSVSGLATGDWLLLYSDGVYITGGSATNELVQIEGISGTTITPTNPVQAAYTTANNAAVKELTLVKNVTIDNVTFLSTNSSGTTLILSFKNAANINIKNSRFNGARLEAIELDDVTEVTIEDTIFEDASTAAGSGIDIEGATRDVLIENCRFEVAAYGVEFASGLPTRWVDIKNSTFAGTDEGVYIQGYTEDLTIDGCTFLGDDATNGQISGLSTGAVVSNLTVSNNRFSGGTDAVLLGSLHVGVAGFYKITNNLIEAGDIYIIDDANSTVDINLISITRNYLKAGGIAVSMNTAGNTVITSMDISNNTVVAGDATFGAIYVVNAAKETKINNNDVETKDISVFEGANGATSVESIQINGNSVGDGQMVVSADGGTSDYERVQIANNTIEDGEMDIDADAGTNDIVELVISGNTISTSAATDPINISDVLSVHILHNQITGGSITDAVEVDEVDNAVISGNTFYNGLLNLNDGTTNVASETIRITDNHLLAGEVSFVGGTSTSTYDRVIISGNTLEDGEVIVTESATTTMTKLAVLNNTISTTAAKAIDIADVGHVDVSGNNITGDNTNMTDGIEVSDPDVTVIIKDNVIDDIKTATDNAIEVVTDDNNATITSVKISGNHLIEGFLDVTLTTGETLKDLLISDNDIDAGCMDLDAGAGTISQITITGNNVYYSGAAALIEIDDVVDVAASNNYLIGDESATTSGIDIDATVGDATNIVAKGNIIKDVVSYGLKIYEVDDVVVSGNDIYGLDTFIAVDADMNAAAGAGKIVVSGNRMRADNSDGVRIDEYEYVNVVGNNIEVQNSTSDSCIDVQEGVDVVIGNNTLEGTHEGIQVENSGREYKNLAISGNSITAADYGIYLALTDTTEVTSQATSISGNAITGSAGDHMLYVYGYLRYFSIAGNTFNKDDDTGDNILLQGLAAGAIAYGQISGNVLTNGDYIIGEATDANSIDISVTGNLWGFEGTGRPEYLLRNQASIPVGSIPGTCSIGEIAYDTDVTDELCICSAANHWDCINESSDNGPGD